MLFLKGKILYLFQDTQDNKNFLEKKDFIQNSLNIRSFFLQLKKGGN